MKGNFILCFGIVLVFSVALVSATGCCGLTEGNVQCTGVSQGECKAGANFAEGVDCDYASFCQEGCCYNGETGVFDARVVETACEESWVKNPTCDMPEAQRGCCVFGEETIYQTEGQCQVNTIDRAMGPNEVVDWRRIDRRACFELATYQSRGACVSDNGGCSIGTESECWERGGEFNEGYLCTSPSLNTSCEMTDQTTCVDGKDGVYFVDSCGNYANIYDSSNVDNPDYWNQEILIEDSCGFPGGNANSKSCGNCDRFAGGMCDSAVRDNFDVDVGNFYCRDLSCEYEGTRYNNGESWCAYDGSIGGGNDTVGSRHWRYTCNFGEIQNNACDDHRNDICVQNFLKEDAGDVKVDAKCIKNDWRKCIEYNDDDEEGAEDCNENPFCEIRGVTIDKFNVNLCSPKYPGGFDLLNPEETNQEENQAVCEMATRTCTSHYVRVFPSRKWKCEVNCDCEKQGFVDKMNDLCIGLGDCGGYVNYNGEYTESGYNSNRGEINQDKVTSFLSNIIPIPGRYISMENYLNATGEGSLGSAGGGFSPSGIFALGDKWMSDLNFFGFGKTKKEYSTFTCQSWQPPVGSDNCEECNNNLLKPCSEYRCESLGAGCEIVNKGTTEEMCAAAEDDGRPPTLGPSRGTISDNEMYNDVRDDGFELTNLNGGCIDAYTPLTFGITTNELSQCMFDIEMKEYGEMRNLGGNSFTYNHTTTFTLPDPSHGQSQGSDWTGDLTFYIKCRDRFGHETPDFYNVDVCVKEGPDRWSPSIRRIDPADDSILPYGTTTTNVSVVTNELATCRWDIADISYADMGNEMFCEDTLGTPGDPQGYLCTDSLELTSATTDYFIKCMDQPWLEELNRSDERNPNEDSTPYRLRRPEEKIIIEQISPAIDFESPTQNTDIDVTVKTANGGEGHTCYYSFSGYENVIEMIDTGGVLHVQPLNRPAGLNNLYIECEDETGDFVQAKTEFRIIYDTSTPQIARVWQIGTSLHIITTEPAECVYSTEYCNFNWINGTSMTGSEEFTIGVIPGKKYHIKCKDEFGNAPSGCSISVSAV
jgi:hypothetical protein